MIPGNSKVFDMRKKEKYTGLAGQTGRQIENRLPESRFNGNPSLSELK
jgi:hypothetical protein